MHDWGVTTPYDIGPASFPSGKPFRNVFGRNRSSEEEPVAWLRAEMEADKAYWERWLSQEVIIKREHGEDHVADCEAKLAILDEHGGEHMCFKNSHDGNTWDYYWGDCPIMRLLASGYKHRPGYREDAWKA